MSGPLSLVVAGLAERLSASRQKLATAESCTGGWIAKACTDVAGSSGWFERGFVTYSNESKQEMLGVPAEILDQHGAVSEPVVREMALGALRYSRAHWSVAVSGIAGPTGGSADKPVGTVWFAWAGPQQRLLTRSCHFAGDRDAVRRQTVEMALQVFADLLEGVP
jgi:nicotinamide-nucleotide amidase